tara:strand:+ start:476 stop:916 length:441 start_codon:yes stop_codon:yes gene_type:complete
MKTFALLTAVVVITVILLEKLLSYFSIEQEKDYFKNDLSRDSKRWGTTELELAAYIGIFETDDVRLDSTLRALMCALLKRSDRAVNEKIRRLSQVGSPTSDASEKDQDVSYYIAALSSEDAKALFLYNLKELGGNVDLTKSLLDDE